MRSPRLLCLLVLSALLSGCGSSPKGTDPNPGVPPNPSVVPLILDGNWEISAPIGEAWPGEGTGQHTTRQARTRPAKRSFIRGVPRRKKDAPS